MGLDSTLDVAVKIVGVLAWPGVVSVILWAWRKEFSAILSEVKLRSLKVAGAEILFGEVESAKGRAAATIALHQPQWTENQETAACEVKRWAETAVQRIICDQLTALALEYEGLRASMPSGDARTDKMERVVAKMRAFSRVGNLPQDFFSSSPSPGQRLVAVVMLQGAPDLTRVDWLADRFSNEAPFVAYHAGVALYLAAQKFGHQADKAADIRQAIAGAKEKLGQAHGWEASDRRRVLADALDALEND